MVSSGVGTGPFGAYRAELSGAGEPPVCTTDGAALEESARRRLAPGPFWYVAGGAGTGATVEANRQAFGRWRIVPRVLRGAHERDLRTTVLGTSMSAPVLLAP